MNNPRGEDGSQDQDVKCRCLIVEDNYFAADVMSIYFKRNNIDCVIAENGQVGLQLYLEDPRRYDVIFLDLQMPVMDGYEMTKQLRNSGTENAMTVPIVAMSGTITGDRVEKDGFSYFLRKPFELKCLLDVIAEVLG